MFITKARVVENQEIKKSIFLLKLFSPEVAATIKPGQFCNIKVSESDYPLLRRPFSICDVEGDFIYFLFNVHGEGTKILSEKEVNDRVDLIVNLGNGFEIEGNFDHSVIVTGGLGVAPFPYLLKKINSKKVTCLVGGRTENDVVTYGLQNVKPATEDGSLGFKGNVVELLRKEHESIKQEKIKIFACGPNPMFVSLKEFCKKENVACDISMECAMACGFGICQGCPVEKEKEDGVYNLVCKDGPVFNIMDVVL